MFIASPVKTNFYGVSLVRSPAFPVLPRRLQHRVSLSRQVRAVISREEKAVDQEDEKSKNRSVVYSSSSPAFPWQRSKYTGTKTVMAVVKIRKKMREKLTERLGHQFELLMKAVGQGMLIQLVSEDIDPGSFSLTSFVSKIIFALKKYKSVYHYFELENKTKHIDSVPVFTSLVVSAFLGFILDLGFDS